MEHLRSGSVAILGIPIANINMNETLWAIEACLDQGGFHQFATANADFLINAVHDRELKEILNACDLVLPDGMPLVWASRIMRTALQERVCGSDLVPRLVELAARRHCGIFLLGSSEESSRGAAKWMNEHYPEARVVGRYCPEFKDLDEMDHEDILIQIEAAQPDILMVAFGSPKQEKWLAMHRHRLRVPICLGVGCSLDLLAGMARRAPHWMQAHGLEWFYRACHDPSRLSMRYARDAYGLIRHLTPQLMTTVVHHKRNSLHRITEETIGVASVLHVSGSLTGDPVPRFEEEMRVSVAAGHHIVLDLSRANYIGPDALGSFIQLENIARRHHREFWLTGMSASLQRSIHRAQLDTNFRTAPKVTDALRQIAPADLQMSIESGRDWAICQVGGRRIRLEREEAAGLCQRLMELIEAGSMRSLDQLGARNEVTSASA